MSTEPEFEYGVQWCTDDGTSYVAGHYTEQGARLMVALSSDAKTYKPHAVAVMRRPVAEWLPVPQEPGTATQATK